MNLEEIKKLYEECEQNVDALAFEMAIPVAELTWKTLCETMLAAYVTQTWKKYWKNMRITL
jgi:hypothetical protein